MDILNWDICESCDFEEEDKKHFILFLTIKLSQLWINRHR